MCPTPSVARDASPPIFRTEPFLPSVSTHCLLLQGDGRQILEEPMILRTFRSFVRGIRNIVLLKGRGPSFSGFNSYLVCFLQGGGVPRVSILIVYRGRRIQAESTAEKPRVFVVEGSNQPCLEADHWDATSHDLERGSVWGALSIPEDPCQVRLVGTVAPPFTHVNNPNRLNLDPQELEHGICPFRSSNVSLVLQVPS